MVKRQKEKQYQSTREHRSNQQQRYTGSSSAVQRTLPFHCCALTLTPYENPVCTLLLQKQNQDSPRLGVIFEKNSLESFLKNNNQCHPITGEKLHSDKIIELIMDKDEEGRWQCPVLTKPFANHSKIVAILQSSQNSAHVYSFQAYSELNVKAKNYTDLISGAKFNNKRDVILLNDPNHSELNTRRDINTFYHITNKLNNQNKSNNNLHFSSHSKH